VILKLIHGPITLTDVVLQEFLATDLRDFYDVVSGARTLNNWTMKEIFMENIALADDRRQL
jgi:hypothetical protein